MADLNTTHPHRYQGDFAYCCELSDFLKILDQFQGVMVSHITDGPGGGNPCIELGFRTEEQALAAATHCQPEGEDPTWIKTLIYRV